MKINLTGATIDFLTVLKISKIEREVFWECKCVCGNICVLKSNKLLAGKSKIASCGCQNWKGYHDNVKYKNPQDASYRSLINRYKQKAVARNIEFKLSKIECITIFNSNCYYCNAIPSNLHNVYCSKSGKARSANSNRVEAAWVKYNGIDRVDSKKYYITNNVVAACSICNYAKLAMTTEEFFSWLQRTYEYNKNCGRI